MHGHGGNMIEIATDIPDRDFEKIFVIEPDISRGWPLDELSKWSNQRWRGVWHNIENFRFRHVGTIQPIARHTESGLSIFTESNHKCGGLLKITSPGTPIGSIAFSFDCEGSCGLKFEFRDLTLRDLSAMWTHLFLKQMMPTDISSANYVNYDRLVSVKNVAEPYGLLSVFCYALYRLRKDRQLFEGDMNY